MRPHPDLAMDYIEFPCLSAARAKAFYTAVFGWKFTDYGPDYTSFSDGRLAGGFTTEAKVSTDGPLVVLYGQNLEAVMAKIGPAGGKIVREIFDFPGGRRFHFADTEGNVLAVWSDPV